MFFIITTRWRSMSRTAININWWSTCQKNQGIGVPETTINTQRPYDIVGISQGSVKIILKDHLSLSKEKSRLVPKSLDFLEKEHRVDVCFSPKINQYRSIERNWLNRYAHWSLFRKLTLTTVTRFAHSSILQELQNPLFFIYRLTT